MYNNSKSLRERSFTPLLFSFVKEFKFDQKNLNKTNYDGVTPLTLAVEKNNGPIILSLITLGANPFVENIHGNTALSLAMQNPCFLRIIQISIEHQTCKILKCNINTEFYYDNKKYKIIKIIPGGSCSLAAIEIEDSITLERYFAKIKSHIGGLEIRNYILLEQYIDLFKIKNLILYNANSDGTEHDSEQITDVYCLIQKIVLGQTFSKAFCVCKDPADRQQIIIAVIKALCALHKQGCIHNDALPDNCYWDNDTRTAQFIDYDVMRTAEDLVREQQDWLEAEYLDFKRLIMGDVEVEDGVVGLMRYIENIENIIKDFSDFELNPTVKRRVLANLIS